MTGELPEIRRRACAVLLGLAFVAGPSLSGGVTPQGQSESGETSKYDTSSGRCPSSSSRAKDGSRCGKRASGQRRRASLAD